MVCCLTPDDERPCISVCFRSPWWSQQNNSPVLDWQRLWQLVVHKSDMPSKKCGSFFRRSHPPPQANLASSFWRSLGVWILSFRTWNIRFSFEKLKLDWLGVEDDDDEKKTRYFFKACQTCGQRVASHYSTGKFFCWLHQGEWKHTEIHGLSSPGAKQHTITYGEW